MLSHALWESVKPLSVQPVNALEDDRFFMRPVMFIHEDLRNDYLGSCTKECGDWRLRDIKYASSLGSAGEADFIK